MSTAQPFRRRTDAGGNFSISQVDIADGGILDAFGRVRVSDPRSLFDAQLQYDEAPLFWDEALVGGGTTTHDPDNSAIDLDVGTASGDKVTRQTKQYIRYQPGKSQKITATGVFDAIKSNQEQRLGYFDDDNGLFFATKDGAVNVTLRSKVTGSVVNDPIAQSAWNLDTLDGSGDANNPSGITLDLTKSQIFAIDLEWLSVGRVRLGFQLDGLVVYAHQFLNANSIAGAYMTTANLPARYEIENTDTVASASTLKQICTSVMSEGGFEFDFGIPLSASNGITTIAVTTRRPILSIRPKATFNSIVNRSQVLPLAAQVLANTNQAFVELVYDGTLTGGTFAVDPGGAVEADIAATAISGGIVIGSFFVAAAGTGANKTGQQGSPIISRLPLTLDIAGANPIPLSVVVTSFTGTANVTGIFNWAEIR